MANNNPYNLFNEMIACGLTITRLDSNGYQTSNDVLAALVVAAHGKGYGDQEPIDLRNYLGSTSAEWLAYKAYRLSSLNDRRSKKIPIGKLFAFLRIWAEAPVTENPAGSGYYVVRPKMTDWNKFRTIIQDIISEIPDEE